MDLKLASYRHGMFRISRGRTWFKSEPSCQEHKKQHVEASMLQCQPCLPEKCWIDHILRLIYELWAWAPGPPGRRDPRSLGSGPRVQTIQPMCAPNVCAEMLRRIFGAPNFVPMCVPNFGCAEFCAEFVCRIFGAPNFSEKQFYLVKQLFYADKIRRINSAQNSAHPKFGTEFGAKFGAPKIRRNISAHTFGVHIGWIVCTRGPDPKDLGSLARPLGPGAHAQSS